MSDDGTWFTPGAPLWRPPDVGDRVRTKDGRTGIVLHWMSQSFSDPARSCQVQVDGEEAPIWVMPWDLVVDPGL